MQFYTIVSIFLAGTAYALPATSPNGYEACPSGGLFGNPQCCSLNLVGVLSGDCRSPTETPTNAKEFEAICAKSGQRARCCAVAEVLELGAFCQKPVGVSA
ncbi:fungal hydrophobin-domain-containing protein [Fusarium redolens]|uniref:Fungal hydrophobin-domain-containing protein n=1 Tax=Fusarium redolens TaxID=48865 RepID=A0A9P9HZT6_FUSRE|nr:fungal hydrophobin-domain-containing protein [Fusarium redolens]KAH7265659.1 fungal hydrophobin-domain-containing protein [Fusarium redolens]